MYLRDSGLLHALLRIDEREQLLGHPVCGMSLDLRLFPRLQLAEPLAGREPVASVVQLRLELLVSVGRVRRRQ